MVNYTVWLTVLPHIPEDFTFPKSLVGDLSDSETLRVLGLVRNDSLPIRTPARVTPPAIPIRQREGPGWLHPCPQQLKPSGRYLKLEKKKKLFSVSIQNLRD